MQEELSAEALRLSYSLPTTYARLILGARNHQTSTSGQNIGASAVESNQFEIWQKAIWLCIKLTNSPVHLSGWRFFKFTRGFSVNLITNLIPFIVILAQFIGSVNDLSSNKLMANMTESDHDDYVMV